MKNLRGFVISVAFLSASLALASCGSSSSTTPADSTVTTDTTTSKAVPDDVVISSPTASTTASNASISTSLVKGEPLPPPPGAKPGDPTGEDFRAKKESMENLISASGECGFTLQIPTITPAACYGPVISYSGHPDSTGGPGPNDGPSGGLPPGDTGIWSALEGSEACSAAKMNELIDKVAARVDNIVKIFGTMACAGKKGDVVLPAVGEQVDMTSVMGSNMSVSGLSIGSAILERLANDDSGNEVYRSQITARMGFSGGTNDSTLVLKHIPTAADNSTYKGKMSFTMHSTSEIGNNCSGVQGETSGGTLAGVILYEKASATSMKYEINYAEFCGADTNPFDVNNNIDPTDQASASNPDGWANDWHYGVFSLNPTNGTGDVAFAWQAGSGDMRTRVLDCTTSEATDGSASGTCYYGFGPNISTATGRGAIDGFVCNWAGPQGAVSSSGGRTAAALLTSGRGQALAQRQVLARAASATVFTPSESKITYAPANNCNATDADFLYKAIDSQGGADLNLDNDRKVAGGDITNNLIPLANVVFTVPTPPTDVQ